jgi:elongation factor Tu
MKKNAESDLLGFDECIGTTIGDIQVFKKSVPLAYAGDNVGVLLRGVKISAVQKGMLLCAKGTENISNHFDAQMYLLTRGEGGRSKPLMSKYIQQIFSRTWNIPCRVDLLEQDMLMPGDHGKVRLTLHKKMVMSSGQPFTIRENGMTVATGIITKTLPPVELPLRKLSKLVLKS